MTPTQIVGTTLFTLSFAVIIAVMARAIGFRPTFAIWGVAILMTAVFVVASVLLAGGVS